MFEDMDNQVLEELDYILPDDYEEESEETTEEETEETEVAEEGETEEATEEVAESVEQSLDELEVKFLHDTKQLKDIPRDELKALVQKGMNHDRISEKLNQANESLDRISDLAKFYDMDAQTLINTLFDNYFQQAADQEGLTKDQIKSNYEQGKQNAEQKRFERFAKTYPDVKPEDIPAEVWDTVKTGEDLTTAYDNYLTGKRDQEKQTEITQLKKQIESLEAKLKTKEQNDSIKKKSPVKPTSLHGNDDLDGDEFLQGLLGL